MLEKDFWKHNCSTLNTASFIWSL